MTIEEMFGVKRAGVRSFLAYADEQGWSLRKKALEYVGQVDTDSVLTRRLEARFTAEYRRQCFEETGNALHAWAAIADGATASGWIRDYLVRSARALLSIADRARKGEDIARRDVRADRVAEALGLKPLDSSARPALGRQPDAFQVWNEPYPDLALAAAVLLQRRHGASYVSARDNVCEQFGASESKVDRAWKRYRSDLNEAREHLLSLMSRREK